MATLLTRMRRRRGRWADGDGRREKSRARIGRLLPYSAPARALLAGLFCLAIGTPVIRSLLPTLLSGGPGPAAIGLATAGYALILSLLVTPPALILALDEDRPRRAPAGR